jgi:hypothetical protein
MHRPASILIRLSLTAAVLVAGCSSDSPVDPVSTAQPAFQSSHTLLGSATTVSPLQRNAAISGQTTSATIGIFGGVLALPGAGVVVIVPPFALNAPTTISVTALAGTNVAYEFAPHGIRFNVPLIMTQDLRGTQAGPGGSLNPSLISVGYFQDAANVTSVTELLNVGIGFGGTTATATLNHFSGYIYAGGRSSEE